MIKNLPANAENVKRSEFNPQVGQIPCGNDNPLQYSCLENFMDRGAWCTTVHRVTKS